MRSKEKPNLAGKAAKVIADQYYEYVSSTNTLGKLFAFGAFSKGRTCMEISDLSLIIAFLLDEDVIRERDVFLKAFLMFLYDPVTVILRAHTLDINEDAQDPEGSLESYATHDLHYNNLFLDYIKYNYKTMMGEFGGVFEKIFSKKTIEKQALINEFTDTMIVVLSLQKSALTLKTQSELTNLIEEAYEFMKGDALRFFIIVPMIHQLISSQPSGISVAPYQLIKPTKFEKVTLQMAGVRSNSEKESSFAELDRLNREIYEGRVRTGSNVFDFVGQLVKNNLICSECDPNLLPIYSLIANKLRI